MEFHYLLDAWLYCRRNKIAWSMDKMEQVNMKCWKLKV
jgi:hypothetical protein